MGKKKAKKVKKKREIAIDEVDTTYLPRAKLEAFLLSIKVEVDREREQRTFFQIERDKLSLFWEISRNKVIELQKQVLNCKREKEEEKEKSRDTEKLQTQKLKHFRCEQISDLNTVKRESQAVLLNEQAVNAARESQRLQDIRDLQNKLREHEIVAEEELRKAKRYSAEVLHNSRAVFEQKIREITESGEFSLQTALAKLETTRCAESAEIEDVKKDHLLEIICSHEKAFNDLRNYYNDITLKNLGLINVLKKRMEGLRQAKECAERGLNDALLTQNKLASTLEKAEEELLECKRRTMNPDKDRSALVTKSLELNKMEKSYDKLKWDFEILKQKYDKVITDKEELNKRLTMTALQLQQRAALKGTLSKMCGKKIVSLN